VKDEWLKKVGPQNETEKDILDLEDGADANSRLSCQIEITDELDGLVVEVVEL
jgi:2Fe-2S ferredoxin